MQALHCGSSHRLRRPEHGDPVSTLDLHVLEVFPKVLSQTLFGVAPVAKHSKCITAPHERTAEIVVLGLAQNRCTEERPAVIGQMSQVRDCFSLAVAIVWQTVQNVVCRDRTEPTVWKRRAYEDVGHMRGWTRGAQPFGDVFERGRIRIDQVQISPRGSPLLSGEKISRADSDFDVVRTDVLPIHRAQFVSGTAPRVRRREPQDEIVV